MGKLTDRVIAKRLIESAARLLQAEVEYVTWVESTGETEETIKLTTKEN